MPVLKFPEAIQQLKQKQYAPIYFFHGEEAFFIDELTKEIEQNALPEEMKSFNQTVIYGKDLEGNLGKLVDAAMRLPMMAERQVVLVKEAQNIKGWDALLPYLKNPTKSTVLVFAHKNKKLDGRSAFAKELKKNAVVVESPLYRDYQIPAWIANYVNAKGYQIDNKAVHLLVEFLGTDLAKISNELEKLFLVLETERITPNEIEKNIGISKDYNVFELQNAFLAKDSAKVFRILNYFEQNPKAGHIVLLISMIYSMFAKLYTCSLMKTQSDTEIAKAAKINPYFLKTYKSALRLYDVRTIRRNIKLLSQYDLRSKGVGNVGVSGAELMKELSFKLML